ncbi:MAG TPA: 16S rRNA (cytidine(1402)-2'-O)-methyltransferase [Anaerolineales bacterium]|nr:16S rRNA (cytidine(1402)-2'-O)-methyltransferase [Anaerolineales bacterium]
MGTLYLVATPIGNLEDISARALRLLRAVKLVAAEDTRVTRNLFQHFDIHTPLTSYFEHNKLTKLDAILAALDDDDVALVSDAGTPGLNDPGYELVRAALEAGHCVSPVPGPASPIAALVASGLPTDSFLYLGYLPRKSSERKKFLERLTELPYTLIFLETPHRLLDALEDLRAALGDRHIAIARELTKVHEEFWRGRLSGAPLHFKEPRGEFVLVVAGRKTTPETWSREELRTRIREEIKAGKTAKDVSSELSERSGWKKRDVYRLTTKENEEK